MARLDIPQVAEALLKEHYAWGTYIHAIENDNNYPEDEIEELYDYCKSLREKVAKTIEFYDADSVM